MTGVSDLIDAASVAHWLEHDEHEVHASFDVKVARWKISATQGESTEVEVDADIIDAPRRHEEYEDCEKCRAKGRKTCWGHVKMPPPRPKRGEQVSLYMADLLDCPAFAWRFNKSLAEVWRWAQLSQREITALDMWLAKERQEDIAKAIHTRKEAVRPIVMEAFAAIRQRVRASIQQQQQLQEAS